jgi:hypothetical protein
MTRKTGIVASGVLLSLLLACQPASLPGVPANGPGQPAIVSLGAPNGASITIAVQPQLGLRTQALPKTAADVHHYAVDLFDSGTNAHIAGPLNIAGNATTGQFVGVANGSYYIKADAFADALSTQSLIEGGGGAVRSTNDVTVNNGVAAYTMGQTTLVVNLPLLNGTVGTASSNVSVGGRATVLPSADKSGLSLWNAATRRATTNAVNPSITYALSSIQTGDISGTAQTHEVWAWAADSVGLKASVPKPFGTGANVSGNPVASIGVVHTAQTVETGGPAITLAAGHGIQVDSANNMYYYDGTNLLGRPSGGNYPSDSTVVDNSAGALTGWVVTTGSNVFFSTGMNIMVRNTAVATAATLAVSTAPGTVGKMAVDEASCLYYIETSSNKIRRCVWNGTAYQAPVDVTVAIPGVTMLAVDSYGSVFYSTGANIFKCTLDTDETTYGAAVQVATGAGITSFCVDRVGNVYFTDAGNAVKFVGATEPATTYAVAGPGTGAAADALTGLIPTGTDLNTPNAVAMSITGRLLFTSQGAVNRFLRYVPNT